MILLKIQFRFTHEAIVITIKHFFLFREKIVKNKYLRTCLIYAIRENKYPLKKVQLQYIMKMKSMSLRMTIKKFGKLKMIF